MAMGGISAHRAEYTVKITTWVRRTRYILCILKLPPPYNSFVEVIVLWLPTQVTDIYNTGPDDVTKNWTAFVTIYIRLFTTKVTTAGVHENHKNDKQQTENYKYVHDRQADRRKTN